MWTRSKDERTAASAEETRPSGEKPAGEGGGPKGQAEAFHAGPVFADQVVAGGTWLGIRRRDKGIIDAHSADKRWIINVQGIKRGRKQPLPIKLSEILTQMEDASADYSMAFNDSIAYRRQWQEIPQSVKERCT